MSSNPGHDAVHHDPATGQFAPGGGGGSAWSKAHERLQARLAAAPSGGTREDVSKRAWAKREFKKEIAASHPKPTAQQSAQWKADLAKARAFMRGEISPKAYTSLTAKDRERGPKTRK